ncbi:MAG: tetratricopeptide repeat protein [Pseudomonadota bacterium]
MPRIQLPFLAATMMGLAACAADPSGWQRLNQSTWTSRGSVPDAVVGDYLRGRFAASQQDYAEAATAFGRVAARQDDPALVASAFRYALVNGDMAGAERFAAQIVESPLVDETHAPSPAGFAERDLPRLTLIAGAVARGEMVEAARLLEMPLSTPLGQSMGYLLNWWVLYDRDGAGEGISHLKSIPHEIFGGFAPLHLGLMFDLSGDFGAAEVAYAEGLGAPASDMAIIAYAGLLERHQTAEDALTLYRKMSEDRGFLRRVGRMGLARLGEAKEGEAPAFLKLAHRTPLRVAKTPKEAVSLVFINYAWSAYEQAAQRQEAAARAGFEGFKVNLDIPLALAQLSVAVDEGQAAGQYIIGAIYSSYGQHAAAAAANKKVAPSSWLYNYAAIDRADAYVKMDKPQEAIRLIENYLEQDALAPDVALTLADLLAEQGDHPSAREAATKAIDVANRLASDDTRGKNLWRYYFARGVMTAEEGDWQVAEADLKEALRLAPEEPLLLNYLGYSYVERGENLDQALSMIERALTKRPTSGAITDSLGWAHYQRGNYEEAVRYLERAVALEPGDDVITDHLGDAYWQTGRAIEARFEWRRVLEIDNVSDELRANVERKLEGVAPAAGAYAAVEEAP